jgi:FAD:protein FMN transferase
MAEADDTPRQRIEAFQPCMGTQFRVTVLASERDIRAAQQAIGKAFQRAAELDAKLSDYLAESELNQLCRRQRMPVSGDLGRVLRKSLEISAVTGGAFDITVGKLIQRWRQVRRSGVLPPPASLPNSKGRLRLTPGGEARLTEPNMQLDLGGIAKGFAAEEMLLVLRQAGFPQALVSAGGDLAVGEGEWRIEIGTTGQTETLSNCFVSTSGDESQFVEIGGVRYSHIVDPRTGLGLTNSKPVTVIANQGMLADALATALQVRPQLASKLRRKYRGIRIAQ